MNIYLDIETKPTSRTDVRERLTAGVKPPGNYKSAEAISKWWAENGEARKAEATNETALDGLWGEICCIGYAIEDSSITTIVGVTETDLLRRWAEDIATGAQAVLPPSGTALWSDRITWIGHNLQDFDIRFLWQRCIVNSVNLPFRLPLDRYPKGPWIYDTMKEWCGYGKYVKQTDLELAFGLTRTDPLKDGNEVLTADIASIRAHCSEDIRLVREIHKRMTV
jgi:hypothetical protein